MLTDKELMQWVLTCPPDIRARVEMLASGDTSIAPEPIGDARTCTQTQAARFLGVSRTTVVNMIKSGRLEAVTVGGAKRVLLKSIDAISRGDETGVPEQIMAHIEHKRRRCAEGGRKGAAARIRNLANNQTPGGL